jgi:hypothetical protein
MKSESRGLLGRVFSQELPPTARATDLCDARPRGVPLATVRPPHFPRVVCERRAFKFDEPLDTLRRLVSVGRRVRARQAALASEVVCDAPGELLDQLLRCRSRRQR